MHAVFNAAASGPPSVLTGTAATWQSPFATAAVRPHSAVLRPAPALSVRTTQSDGLAQPASGGGAGPDDAWRSPFLAEVRSAFIA